MFFQNVQFLELKKSSNLKITGKQNVNGNLKKCLHSNHNHKFSEAIITKNIYTEKSPICTFFHVLHRNLKYLRENNKPKILCCFGE